MAYVIAQISDVHIGGHIGSGDRCSEAVEAINAMTRQPDLVLVTGDPWWPTRGMGRVP